MRYATTLLAWYLDLLVFLTASFLIRCLFLPDLAWGLLADFGVFLPLRFVAGHLATTPGQWLLAPAASERRGGASAAHRQWPNLLAGTLLFLEGTKSTVRWLEMDHPIPFMGHLPEGSDQGLLGLGMGALFMVAGAALLRLEPIGRTLGFLVLAVTSVSIALSWGLWDAVVERMVTARRSAQGIGVRGDEIVFMQSVFPEALVAAILAIAGLLLICRRRAH